MTDRAKWFVITLSELVLRCNNVVGLNPVEGRYKAFELKLLLKHCWVESSFEIVDSTFLHFFYQMQKSGIYLFEYIDLTLVYKLTIDLTLAYKLTIDLILVDKLTIDLTWIYKLL